MSDRIQIHIHLLANNIEQLLLRIEKSVCRVTSHLRPFSLFRVRGVVVLLAASRLHRFLTENVEELLVRMHKGVHFLFEQNQMLER